MDTKDKIDNAVELLNNTVDSVLDLEFDTNHTAMIRIAGTKANLEAFVHVIVDCKEDAKILFAAHANTVCKDIRADEQRGLDLLDAISEATAGMSLFIRVAACIAVDDKYRVRVHDVLYQVTCDTHDVMVSLCDELRVYLGVLTNEPNNTSEENNYELT